MAVSAQKNHRVLHYPTALTTTSLCSVSEREMKRMASKASMNTSSSAADTTRLPPEPLSEPRTAVTNGTVKAAPPASTEAKLDAETATELLVTLRDVTLQLQRGRLVGVAGSVGSGKTSMLTAIMGQVSRPWSSASAARSQLLTRA